jgi:hypothetical protein
MPGPNRHTEGLFDFLDVTGSTLAANGEIRVNLGDSTKGTGADRNVPLWGIDGFLSRPIDPDANGAAQAFFVCDGNQRYVIGTRDRRDIASAGTLDVGDRVMYTQSGVRILVDDSDHSVRITVPGGGTMYFAFDEFRVSLGSGASLELTDTGFNVSLPTAIPTEFTLDASGAVISTKNLGQTINLDTLTQVTLGLNIGGIRPGIPTVENVNIGPGGGITVPSPKVFAASA